MERKPTQARHISRMNATDQLFRNESVGGCDKRDISGPIWKKEPVVNRDEGSQISGEARLPSITCDLPVFSGGSYSFDCHAYKQNTPGHQSVASVLEHRLAAYSRASPAGRRRWSRGGGEHVCQQMPHGARAHTRSWRGCLKRWHRKTALRAVFSKQP